MLYGDMEHIDISTGQTVADWNHTFHPAREVTSGGFGGDAVRNARMQFVSRATHNEYHKAYCGPELPQNPTGRFRVAGLCAAGYIPPQAISLAGRSPKIVDLTLPDRERLRSSGEVRVASLSIVSKFIKDFILEQPVDHIDSRIVDDFLSLDPSGSIYDAKRRRYLTHLLLSLVIDRVEDHLEEPYVFAHSSALLQPGLPKRPGDFVQGLIVSTKKSSRRMAQELVKKFTIYRDGSDIAAQRLGGLALVA
jgi:hypothetical protein